MARAASRSSHQRWLSDLTDLPTASGQESAVQAWVRAWARQRGLSVSDDRAGNLLVRPTARSRKRPIVAVAHMDHPAFVVTSTGSRTEVELRGGVFPEYVAGARLQLESRTGARPVRLVEFDATTGRGWAEGLTAEVGDIVRWAFPPASLGVEGDRLRARACDDLAGAAAALSALDRLTRTGVGHFSVLLTRAEEIGFVGAIAACELKTLPAGARVLSIECSRQSADAPVGGGPIVRVGDASSVFSSELTNRVSDTARSAEIPHQRKLMSGGSCEATAFAALGYEATGLCLALDNFHNMADIDGVRSGKRQARLRPEVISLKDFHGLVDLLEAVALGLDSGRSQLPQRLRSTYREQRYLLD
ncbi:MAG TPA: M20/M25/M40 family metallo-hydrolase [Acidimicrobiia bacterium]|nr:M20/M25/M40 family metallo-hydrolase [Acidimicrobiia bacterium]